jgi:GNAT superfamily N-acetyltransferase
MGSNELLRIAEIDRRERIDVLIEQRGTQLVERHGRWDAAGWDPDGTGGHSVAAKVREAQQYVDDGGVVVGAFAGGRLIGIGIVVPHLRPQIAQLAFLHVSAPFRKTGVGRRLAGRLDEIARDLGATEMVVSATPSLNTVRFYLACGFQPSEEPLIELAQLEPDDIHMHKAL